MKTDGQTEDTGTSPGIFTRFGNPEAVDGSADGAISSFPLASLRSSRCSAVPLLTLWRNEAWRRKFLRSLDVEEDERVYATFEYRVPWHCGACGKAKARGGVDSHTDLMLETPTSAVAIEAKYTEPRYATVAAWLEKGSDRSNREAVLRHWLHLISATTGQQVSVEQVGPLVYQHVHRTASACSAAGRNRQPRAVHLLFGRDERRWGQYRADLQRLRNLLALPSTIGLHLVGIEVEPDERLDLLYGRHQRRDRTTAEEVKAALLGPKPLYRLKSIEKEDIA